MVEYSLPADTGINFTTGIDQAFVYVSGQVPIFIPLLLFSFFMIVLLGGYFAEQRRTGVGDSAQWFSIAGYLTSIAALMMLLIDNLIQLPTVIITLTVAFVGALWFFFSRDK